MTIEKHEKLSTATGITGSISFGLFVITFFFLFIFSIATDVQENFNVVAVLPLDEISDNVYYIEEIEKEKGVVFTSSNSVYTFYSDGEKIVVDYDDDIRDGIKIVRKDKDELKEPFIEIHQIKNYKKKIELMKFLTGFNIWDNVAETTYRLILPKEPLSTDYFDNRE